MNTEKVEEVAEIRNEYSEMFRENGDEELANKIELATADQLTQDGFFTALKMSHPNKKNVLDDLKTKILEVKEEDTYNPHQYFDDEDNFKASWLADDIEKDYNFKKLRDSEEMYVYKNGYYQPKGEQIVEEECSERLGDRWTSHYQNEVINKINSQNYIDRHEFRPPKRKINLKNGVYDLVNQELKPHSSEYYFTHKIPIKYNPDASCPEIHKFLNEIVETEREVKTLREIAGYLLLPDYPVSKAFMLIGKGSNGKSLYLDLLKEIVGSRNYTNKSLQELEQQRFATHNLYGNLACFDDDLPSDKLQRTNKLKKLTGGSDIGAEVKYGGSYDFKNFAKLVYACNELPRTSDDSDGFYRRWILVEFPYKFTNNSDDEHKDAQPRMEKMQKLTQQEELEGFLWWSIEAMKDVLNNNEFTYAPTSQEARKKWRKYSKPLVRFIEKYVNQGKTFTQAQNDYSDESIDAYQYDYVRKDFLAEVIADYCEAHSHSRPSKKAIKNALDNSDLAYGNKRTRQEPEDRRIAIFSGLKLEVPVDKCPGVRTYSVTFTQACGHSIESSKQSVDMWTGERGPSLSAEIKSKVKDLAQENRGASVEEIIADLDYDEERIEEMIQNMEREGELFEPQPGEVKAV